MKRRDFVKTVALSGMAVAASDLVGDLIAQTPQGKVLESKFKGLSDIALLEAKTQGCTYADIRFTRNTNSGVNATGGNREFDDFGGGFGGRGRRARRPWWRTRRRRRIRRRWRRGTERRRWLRRARHPQRRLGLREQPDRHRGRDSAHHAHGDRSGQGERDRQAHGRQAGAGSGLHASTGSSAFKKDPRTVPQDEKQAYVQKIVDAVVKTKEVTNVNASVQLEHEWKYFASSRRVLHRAGDLHDDAVVHRHGAERRPDAVADVQRHRR